MMRAMKAVVCEELGPPDALQLTRRELPEPGPGEVRVEVKAAGVNYVDGLIASGRYQVKIPPPFIPGSEIAGVIDAVGDGVTDRSAGERVFATVGVGGFAEAVTLRADRAVPIPDALTFAQAASFHQSYATAWFSFRNRIHLETGEWVLITGAGGGIGLAAIDVARALGAHVIGVASTAEKRDFATKAGAEATIDSTTEDVKVRAREISGGGVDVVYDPVGGSLAEPALRALGHNGRFLVVGFTGGIPQVPLNLVLLNNRNVVGIEWGGWAMRHPKEDRAMLEEILGEAAAGRLHPVAPQERPLEEAGTAISDLLERRAAGKIVLVP
jgi:NADPH2:quinone reductase